MNSIDYYAYVVPHNATSQKWVVGSKKFGPH